RFTVLTGTNGQGWVEAAATVSAELGMEIPVYRIGPAQDYTDTYGDWQRLREIADDGCVLVRPDNHVGYRALQQPQDPTAALREALRSLLHLDGADTALPVEEETDDELQRLTHQDLQRVDAQ
ncbi:phenol 2-monooxygenase, partial [Corynebacterium sp. YIM 101645]|nr:phenol 2-monooxygenase [Corynebacterium lemuris]